jgi:outer membrane protein OmpA-like peptidoglycan-associated protein
MKKCVAVLIFCVISIVVGNTQTLLIEGYVYETDNRGYLNEVYVTIYDANKTQIVANAATNLEGYFSVEVVPGYKYVAIAKKDLFFEKEVILDATDKKPEEKLFLKFELEREPGYLFDVTIAPERSSEDEEVDGIVGARIEIYNNTTEEQILNIDSHPSMNFQFTFKKGNHYTVLVRKEGYFTKRMEAFVNVDGCILCFEGIGEVKPAVTDNLTAGHEMGTLLANVEMKPIEIGEGIALNHIYYDYNSAKIRNDALEELETLIDILRDNAHLIVELGSHTDSRGHSKYNLELSQRRAESVVDYLITQGNINKFRVKARGYGATKLVNKCVQGVECTEEQHQENRRTELKVVGFLDVDPMKDKSLQDIKEEEMIEALLREVQQSEVIEIPAGGEMPESLKKQLEEEGKAQDKNSDPELEVEDVKEVVTEIIQHDTIQIGNDSEEISTNAKDKLSQIFEEKKADDEIIEDRRPDDFIEKPVQAIIGIDEKVTGFLIQIMHSSNSISDVGNMWKDFDQIYEEKRVAGGFSYLVGIFNSKEQARESMEGILSKDFPDAFIVEFKNGQRVK